MNALDLFSGIGGITHGLREIVHPIAYVENDNEAVSVLRKINPTVPVYGDIREFDATLFKGNVDIITAGWPCTGFSLAGKKTGFEHEASGLFAEVIRVTRECNPKYLFLENSHVLSLRNNLEVVVKEFDTLGYDCRWTTCRATCVNALHQRHRWFCLVVKRDILLDFAIPDVGVFDWESNEPPRQVTSGSKDNRTLVSLAGNAVVPDQVRYAMKLLRFLEFTGGLEEGNCKNGYSLNGRVYKINVKHPKRPPVNIVLTPRDNEASFALRCKTENVVAKSITQRYWPTPLFSNKYATKCPRTLTKRVSKMLSTCVGFCKDGDKSGYLSARWVLWLMGYDSAYI